MSGGAEVLGVEVMQSWAEAVAAVGTGAGFLIAALVFWQQQRDRRDDEARQARLVHRTRRTHIARYSGGRRGPGDHANRMVAFDVENQSDAAIHGLRFRRVKADGVWGEPNASAIRGIPERIEAGKTELAYLEEFDGPRDLAIEDWDVEWEFVDAEGRRWLRRGVAQPRRLR